jgi:NTE family protein
MINNLQRARLAAARASCQPLLCIDLDLDRRVGLWETGAMPYLFEAGRRSAEVRLPEIFAMLERSPPALAA